MSVRRYAKVVDLTLKAACPVQMLNRFQVWRSRSVVRSGMREQAKTFAAVDGKIKILLAFLT
ncbi:hypothetical protein D3C80_1023120 [compost metagenome]